MPKYIHELPNWPKFQWDQKALAAPLAAVRHRQGRLVGPMQVVSGAVGRERVHYEAPQAAILPGEMKAFLDRFEAKDDIDPVLKAGIAHLWFVTIHPFEDGNGRIVRAIADMMLARSDH